MTCAVCGVELPGPGDWCDDCFDYEEHWRQLTSEEQLLELEAIHRYEEEFPLDD